MSPYKKNYFIIFKLITSSRPKKIFSYFNDFNAREEKTFKDPFTTILNFIILVKKISKKKESLFYFFWYRKIKSTDYKQSNGKNIYSDLTKFIEKFSANEIFFIFLIKFFDLNKLINKKFENKIFSIKLLCCLIDKIQNLKMFAFILKKCFLSVELVLTRKIKDEILNELRHSIVIFILKKNQINQKKEERFNPYFFLSFHNTNTHKSKCKLFFYQLLLKIFLTFEKKQK